LSEGAGCLALWGFSRSNRASAEPKLVAALRPVLDRVFRRRDVEQVAAQVQLELPMAGDAEILLQLVSGAGMIADFQGAESAKFGHARHVAVRDARTLMSQQCFQGRGNPCL
jgi:hypothetical protein